jgi:hypothetical protein
MTFDPNPAVATTNPQIDLYFVPRLRMYLPGETLEVQVYLPQGQRIGWESFQIEAFAGSGFAGQVYRALPQVGVLPGTQIGVSLALKFLRPSSRWKERFRDVLFFLSYQTIFAPRLREPGLQAGLLLTEILHQLMVQEDGQSAMFARPLGYFWDERLATFAEIYSWEIGRPPFYTPDDGLILRWFAGRKDPPDSEMQRKKQFMHWLADRCYQYGAQGIARQFEWGTWVAQSNVLTRPAGSGNEAEFVAVDWRPGLAVPFFLPLSPAHARLIVRGIWRGQWVQFDQVDHKCLLEYLGRHPEITDQVSKSLEAFLPAERAYRAGLPDLWQSGDRLLENKVSRKSVQAALIEDWEKLGRVGEVTAKKLKTSRQFFSVMFFFSFLPLVGTRLQKLAGCARYRAHLWCWLSRLHYRQAALDALCARDLIEWQWQGRVPASQIDRLTGSRRRYLLQKITLSWLPATFHRLVVDRQALSALAQRWFVQPARLLVSAGARQAWLALVVKAQVGRGVVAENEAEGILLSMQDPRLHTFVRDLGLFVGLEFFARLVYLSLAIYGIAQDNFWPLFVAALGPVSPSGVLRLGYILLELVADLPSIFQHRDLRLLTARLSGILIAPWRFIGNFCVPVEMFAYEPRFALLVADYFTSELVRHVPVFGGRGRLLEYVAFQLTFNLPLSVERALRVGFSKLASR